MVLADRGYDADWIRALAADRGAWANIPPRCNRKELICFSPYLYRARNLVERFFNKIKHCRRVATRYDKLAAIVIQFGDCEGQLPNCLPIVKGWNYTVRLYRPRTEILNGTWTFPTAQAVN
jgi:Transposase DDE domain